jgi:hypothetical protein
VALRGHLLAAVELVDQWKGDDEDSTCGGGYGDGGLAP